MSTNPKTLNELELDTLPRFERNKPNNQDLFSFDSRMPVSNGTSSHLLVLSEGRHESYARIVDRRTTEPGFDGEPLTPEAIESLRALSDQIKCVAALAALIESGPDSKAPLITRRTIPPIVLTQFVSDNPYFFVTAQEDTQEAKDPRYVAKIEEIVPARYKFGSGEVSVEVVVSDTDGKVGRFPKNTKNWLLAHQATTHMIDIGRAFPYINDGYR